MNLHDNEYQQTLRYAAARLAKREYSVQELRERLVHYVKKHQYNGINSADIDDMILYLQEEGLLSDSRYADMIVRYYGDTLGSKAIVHRLRTKGVPESMIASHRAELKSTELNRAYGVWQKKFDTPPSEPRVRRQQSDYLLRRGFSSDTIRRLFDALYHDDLSELV